EVDELWLIGGSEMVHTERTGGLRQALDDQHARHYREAGKVALEERLVDADGLDDDRALVAVHVDDAVHEQERVAVRQQFQDAPRVRGRQRPIERLTLGLGMIHACRALPLPPWNTLLSLKHTPGNEKRVWGVGCGVSVSGLATPYTLHPTPDPATHVPWTARISGSKATRSAR